MAESIATVGDLAGICGHDGTNWEKVLIDSSKRLVIAIASAIAQECQLYGWDGDSWEKLQVDANKYLKITIPIEEALGARAYHYDGSNWRRSNLLFGYNATVSEAVDNLNMGAGTQTLDGASVGAGEVWVVSTVIAQVNSATCTALYLQIDVGGVAASVQAQIPPTSGSVYVQTGQFILAEDDYVRLLMTGLTAGDDAYLRYAGYKMDINM